MFEVSEITPIIGFHPFPRLAWKVWNFLTMVVHGFNFTSIQRSNQNHCVSTKYPERILSLIFIHKILAVKIIFLLFLSAKLKVPKIGEKLREINHFLSWWFWHISTCFCCRSFYHFTWYPFPSTAHFRLNEFPSWMTVMFFGEMTTTLADEPTQLTAKSAVKEESVNPDELFRATHWYCPASRSRRTCSKMSPERLW